jgi:hypothetical protein
MLRRVYWYIVADVSEKLNASIFRGMLSKKSRPLGLGLEKGENKKILQNVGEEEGYD